MNPHRPFDYQVWLFAGVLGPGTGSSTASSVGHSDPPKGYIRKIISGRKPKRWNSNLTASARVQQLPFRPQGILPIHVQLDDAVSCCMIDRHTGRTNGPVAALLRAFVLLFGSARLLSLFELIEHHRTMGNHHPLSRNTWKTRLARGNRNWSTG